MSAIHVFLEFPKLYRCFPLAYVATDHGARTILLNLAALASSVIHSIPYCLPPSLLPLIGYLSLLRSCWRVLPDRCSYCRACMALVREEGC